LNKNIFIHFQHGLIGVLLFSIIAMAQDTTESLAFKNNRPVRRPSIFYQPDLAYQLWQHFNLIRDANAGDAMAEHELGIRYLLGEGFPKDTVQGAYWIGKAAKQNLTGACYNYGILLNNGWGVAWNPFEAFNYFLEAANDEMPQAQYLIGLSFTDNLIVKRDWSKSYYWLKRSAGNGFTPAKDALTELLKRIPPSSIDTSDTSTNVTNSTFSKNNPDDKVLASSSGLVFIDFNTVRDTLQQVTNRMILDDVLHKGNDSLAKALNISFSNDSTFKFDKASLNLLEQYADNGSPEALTLIGKLYEIGIYFKKDLIKSSEYYVRAAKLDSPRAPYLLWNELHAKNYFQILKNSVKKNDPRAMFVWYGLFGLQFDNQITPQQAEKFLIKSASENFVPALNELGLNYYTGKIFKKDINKAVLIWTESEKLGSNEAKVQLSIIDLYQNNSGSESADNIKILTDYSDKGSVLAQASLGYCYETGIAVEKDFGTAAKYFRFAAQRGSQYAYTELKKMYDDIRPQTPEFNLN